MMRKCRHLPMTNHDEQQRQSDIASDAASHVPVWRTWRHRQLFGCAFATMNASNGSPAASQLPQPNGGNQSEADSIRARSTCCNGGRTRPPVVN